MDNVDLEAGDGQPHDATTGSQDDETSAFDFYIDQSLTPSQVCRLFLALVKSSMWGLTVNLMGREEGPDHGGDTYIWFKPDAWSEAEGDNNHDKVRGMQHKDPRLSQGTQHKDMELE